jgi:selenocysteine insertion sequence-binding protein 2
MPISFAEALKKPAPKPPPPPAPPKSNNEQAASKAHTSPSVPSSWPAKAGIAQGGNRQSQQQRGQKHKDKPNQSKTSKRPSPQPQNASSTNKKKPKPSGNLQLGDVLKLPKTQQKSPAVAILAPPQAAPDLGHDSFPSLGDASQIKLPAASTWGKAAPTKPKVLLAKSAPSLLMAKSTPKQPAKRNEDTQKIISAETSMLMASFSAKQRSEEEENQMGTFLKMDPATVKKGKQRLGPRKKHFTTLKKKVLQERLEQWRAQNPELLAPSPADSVTKSSTVALWNYFDPKEAEDEDELNEILTNLREMASKVGVVVELQVQEEKGHAFCLFQSSQVALAAQSCWNGLVLGGEKLEVEQLPGIVPSDPVLWRRVIKEFVRKEEGEASHEISEVILENILTEEDLEDEECLEESIADIRDVAVGLGTLLSVKVENFNQLVLAYQGTQKALNYFHGKVIGGQVVTAFLRESSVSLVLLLNALSKEDSEDDDCLQESVNDLRQLASQYGTVNELRCPSQPEGAVLIVYEGNIAQAAASKLDGHVIGGQTIQAKVVHNETLSPCHTIILQNLLTDDDLEDEDCLEETKADVAELAGKFGCVTRIQVDLDERVVKIEYRTDDVSNAVKQFNGMLVGGQTISARIEGNEAISMEGVVGTESGTLEKTSAESQQPMYSGDKLISERFAECKRAPKLANPGIPRKYATLIDDETVKPLLTEMLGELMRLQKRAVEEKNSKARRRIVMGLREVARGIRARKVKMVVMANNLDEYGAIDEKLQEIIDVARQESVPIFYEFNKRGLGKAIGKSIKIGVVGVQNAEGAHQQFKKLLSLASKHGAY